MLATCSFHPTDRAAHPMEPESAAPVAAGHKTYVFVEEFHRQKRLKIMRACDGCRKRKIRCDGALQNGPWPCGSCVRLKLKCVPPTLEPDEDHPTPESSTSSNQFTFQSSTPASTANFNGSPARSTTEHDWISTISPSAQRRGTGPTSIPSIPENGESHTYPSHLFGQHLSHRLDAAYSDDEIFTPVSGSAQFHSDRASLPSLFRTQTEASEASSGDPKEVDDTVKELSEQLGDLSIDFTSVASYIAKEQTTLAETPAIEEVDIVLPLSVSTDSTVRIPPEMMPSEERALDYFGYFFEHIHPYTPVLHREEFYEQWRTSRQSISPLVLEGIFACVARYLEEPIEVRKWLALASRHEESFKDVPRLSTIQALILLTKAREFVPKRGYYYRSWMAVKYMTTMAFDLGLHMHFDQHQGGNRCVLSRPDCIVRTRIWQTLFSLEILIGAPQGRTDFAVELDSVDFRLPVPSCESDNFEYQTSRRTTYFMHVVRNIKRTNNLWQSMRRQKEDWALDSQFARHNEVIDSFLNELPRDLQLQYGDDDTQAFLSGNHYVAYLHIYYHLTVIMHHRPQLQMLLAKRDATFQKHLDICNESAVIICRLQEALYREFKLHGLQFMLRGIGFTIYCVLTCTMLHLVTITSPNAVTNSRARMYFTRHMRILEKCISNASQEMQDQINTLREAFSMDINKPFELRPGLGLRSPSVDSQAIPTSIPPEIRRPSAPKSATWSHLHDASTSGTLSPASEFSQPFDQLPPQPTLGFGSSSLGVASQPAFAPTHLHQVTSAPQSGFALEPVISPDQTTPVWDPSGIFNHWNTAFGAAPASIPPNPPPAQPPRMQIPSATAMQQARALSGQRTLYTAPQSSSAATPGLPESIQTIPTVTPVMWQDAFTSAYISGHGQKRYREEGIDASAYAQYQKRRG